MPSSYIGIQEPAGASQTAKLDAWGIDRGGTTFLREVMLVGGTASDALAAVVNTTLTTGLYGQVVRPVNSSAEPFHVTPTTTVPISGNTTAVVGNSSGAFSTANPLPVLLQSSTATVTVQGNTTALLTTGSKVQVEPVAGAVFAISGNATVVVANASGGITTANPLPVALQNSTATVTIQGNTSAAISGNTTAVVANSSGQVTTANPLAVYLQGSTATVSVQGNVSAAVTAIPGAVQINTTAGSTALLLAGADGNTSQSTARALKVNASQELVITGAVTVAGNASVQGNVSAAISGNTTAVVANSSGQITSANPLHVYLQNSTATVSIQGNTTAILTTGSKVQVEPVAGAVFPISGNASAVITALPGAVQINTTVGSTALLIAGADGNTSQSTARALKVNASQELVITGAVTVVGNASVQGNVSAAISGNATAVLSNTSGNITTANPLAVYLQGSTATVSVQGNVSAAISGNATAVLSNTSGNITTANPLAVYLQGSTATVTVQGNVSAAVAGNVTAFISTAFPAYVPTNGTTASGGLLVMGLDGTATNSTARPLQVNASGELKVAGSLSANPVGNASINATAGSTMVLVGGADGGTSNSTARALWVNTSRELVVTVQGITGNASVVGNVTAFISTAFPAYIPTNGTTASGGLLIMGLDGTATNSTARPLQVNASGELKVAGSLSANPVGNASINATAGSTMVLVGGADGGTSNSTARALWVNTSRELVVTVQGITGNASVVGNVSAVISGNSTAVLSNTSGNITTGNPLAVYLQGSTATVSVQGNVSAAVAGNVTAVISTAFPAYIPTNGTTASGGLLVMGLDGTATNSTARPLQVDASGKLKVDAGTLSVGGLVQINTSGGSTAMLVAGLDGGTSNSTARPLKVNASQELIVTGAVTISGNSTAVLTTGSKVQVEPVAGAVFPISGNASVVVTAMPGTVPINTTVGTTALLVAGADGNTSNSTARILKVNSSQELVITGNVTIVGNASVQGNVSAAVAGNVTAFISTAFPAYIPTNGTTASGGLVVMGLDGTATNSTARPLQVDASGKLKVDAGTISVGGLAQINTSAGSTMMVVGGVDGGTSNSTARALNVNASRELVITGAVTVAGNASVQGNVTALLTTGSIVRSELSTNSPVYIPFGGASASGGLVIMGLDGTATNSTARPFRVNASQELLIAGTVAVAGNVSVQGNVSAAVAGNVTAFISTAFPAYIPTNGTTASGGLLVMGLDGTATNSTARPLQVNASGELKVAGSLSANPVGNASINATAGSTMVLVGGADGGTSNSTARALWVNTSRELVVTVQGITGNASVVGNVTAFISTAFPAYIPTNGTTASGGLLVMGLDGTATNSTARPVQINASGELRVAGTFSATPYANASINATAGSTMLLVGGADGGTSNSTARALKVNASQELVITGAVSIAGNASVQGNVSAVVTNMPGAALINTSAGTSALLIAGADGNTSNSTVRALKVNTSQELVITGAVSIAGNASVQGNVSAVISGNATAVLTTGSTGRVELSTGGMGGATASPVYVAAAGLLGTVYQGSTALTPQFSSMNVTASGVVTIVSSAAGAIYVLAVQFSAQSSCTIQWLEATTSGITGVQAVAANGGFVLPYNPVGWFKTASGLQLALSVQGSSGGVGGSLVYARPAS